MAVLMDAPFSQFFDGNGDPLVGGKVYFYQAGSFSIAKATYTSAAQTVQASNPVILDADGRAQIWVAGSYNIVTTDANDVTIQTTENYTSYTPDSGGASNQQYISLNPGCRLYVVSGQPTADAPNVTTIYYGPYKHPQTSLYDVANGVWRLYSISERSLSLAGLTNALMHDVFLYDNSGTPTLEAVAWTNNTTRATALVLQDGIYVKSGARDRRYVGSFYTTGAGQTSSNTQIRGVWNMDNRIAQNLQRLETASSWSYTGTTLRYANNNSSNFVAQARGLDIEPVDCSLTVVGTATAAGTISVYLGIDALTTNPARSSSVGNSGGGFTAGLSTRVSQKLGIGYHTLNWGEVLNATTSTSFTNQNGLEGVVFA